MIKRIVLCLLLSLVAFTAAGEEMDMIVLLDVSESMFPYFDDTVNFLLKDIVDEHLEYGDGFHLLSFASIPEREIFRVIKSNDDMEAILARIMLLHPLGKYTDLLFALEYLYDYVSELSLSTSKNILILTDGIHDPPPGTSYPADTEEERLLNRERAVTVATALKREGWKVRLIEFPRGEDALASDEDEENNLFAPMAETLGVDVIKYEDGNGSEIGHTATGAPSLEFPSDLGAVSSRFTIPFTVRNFRSESILVELDQILTRENNILTEPVQLRVNGDSSAKLNAKVDLEGYEPGEYLLELDLIFGDDLRIYPRSGEISFELRESSYGWLKYLLIAIVVIVALYLLIFYTIVPLRRHIESSADSRTYVGLEARREEEEESGLMAPRMRSDEQERGTGTDLVPFEGAASPARRDKVPLEAVGGTRKSGKVPLMQSGETAGMTGGRGKIPLSQITSSRLAGSHPLQAVRQLGNRPIEFRLSGQNPFNGGRNIRWIGKSTRSVGGGSSFFLIFLVKVPERIAEISFTEKGLRFRPVRTEFFPALHGDIENCIDRPIELVTDHGTFTMIFREWISPLERINQVLHLTDEPGLQNFD